VTREFFAAHTIRELEQESDYWLEQQGRLTEPMRYDPATDHYVPVTWDAAFALVARELNVLDDPNEAEFYTSGRTTNEGAFMYQLFARRFGTNNFPDCSNMCHEPTSVGLPESIGIGKGTVLLDDFAYSDAIFIIGQQPGTNSPRMLTELHNASRRGVPIVVFNPLRERALERFAALRSIRRRSPPHHLGRHIERKRLAARPIGAGGEHLYAGERRHRLLRHGDHPTSARHRKCTADCELIAIARQFRQAWSGDLPGARSFERARRPHNGRRRKPEAGITRSDKESIRL
jgi:NADH dehydrogenase/NADH:ubiquinone oxidoreductase subunit G